MKKYTFPAIELEVVAGASFVPSKGDTVIDTIGRTYEVKHCEKIQPGEQLVVIALYVVSTGE